MNGKLTAYLPGILLFIATVILGMFTYKDYGVCWDEPLQRGPGITTYEYVFHGNMNLFTQATDNHGAGFELPLVILEKWMGLTDTKDIYEMRHLVSHLLFLVSVLAGYFLIYSLFKNNLLAILGFLLLAFMPRIYAHSFFNSKDIPFLAMFIITFAVSKLAFDRNKPALFCLLGLVAGYATSIRIMGILLAGVILFFLAIDWLGNRADKEASKKTLLNMGLFTLGFAGMVYLAWPYLWPAPIKNFNESFAALAHFEWDANILINGLRVKTTELPWTYIPTWFAFTNPILWLLAGLAGLVAIGLAAIKKPMLFLKNTRERNFLLYLICFFAPIMAVIGLNSVVYDDWRHLYFVYPSFVLAAIYGIDVLLRKLGDKFKYVVYGLCLVQLGIVADFMVKNHPFHQVYFNELVSREPEYLRENFELEYWGCGFKQGLDHVVAKDKSDTIRMAANYNDPLVNNIMLLNEADRKRIKIVNIDQIAQADYFISNFRGHPEDYPSKNIEFDVKVLNSTILCVYRLKK